MTDWIPCLYCHQAINIDDEGFKCPNCGTSHRVDDANELKIRSIPPAMLNLLGLLLAGAGVGIAIKRDDLDPLSLGLLFAGFYLHWGLALKTGVISAKMPGSYTHNDYYKIDDPDRYWLGVCVEALPVIGLAIALAVSL